MTPARVLALAPLQIAQALVGLGAIAAFTRLMSAEEFGHYAIALSASLLAHTLLFTWAEAAAFRFLPIARAERRLADHFATLLVVAAALGIGVVVVTGAVLAFANVGDRFIALAAFAAGAAVLRFILRIARESERASLEVGRYAAGEAAYVALGFAVGVGVLIQFDLGAAAPFAGLFAAGVLMLLIDLPRLRRQARGGRASAARAVHYAAYGAPLALALAADLAVQTLVRLILAAQAGAGEVGAYAAAFGLVRPLDILFLAAGAAFSPLLLRAYENEGAQGAQAPARAGIALMAAIAAPAAVGLALVAAPLSTLLVGEAMSANAARALPWLAFAGFLSGFNLYYLSEAFQLTRRTGLRAIAMLAPGAVQLAFTLVLTPDLGAAGAAIGAAVGALIAGVLLLLIGRRLLVLPMPLAAFARVGAATATMALAVLAIPGPDLLTAVAVGALVYVLAAFAFDVAGIRAVAASACARLSARPTTEPEPTHAP